ncbi:hypothetical protein ABPG72_013347 [Tetrahymena utriculariae]
MDYQNQEIGKVISENFRNIPDFPQPGIIFKDIAPLLSTPAIFKRITDAFVLALKDIDFDKIVILESRGFIFGTAIGLQMGKGLILIRKKGKLPGKVEQFSFDLEYGKDVFEIQSDALAKGEKVVIVDDILATGGTADAACRLVEKVGGVVSAVLFLYQIKDLKGEERLSKYKVINLHVE